MLLFPWPCRTPTYSTQSNSNVYLLTCPLVHLRLLLLMWRMQISPVVLLFAWSFGLAQATLDCTVDRSTCPTADCFFAHAKHATLARLCPMSRLAPQILTLTTRISSQPCVGQCSTPVLQAMTSTSKTNVNRADKAHNKAKRKVHHNSSCHLTPRSASKSPLLWAARRTDCALPEMNRAGQAGTRTSPLLNRPACTEASLGR